MKKTFRCEVVNDVPTIYMYDDIGPEWLGMVSAETVVAQLDSLGKVPQINVRLNSPGGDVDQALAIYNALVRNSAEVVIDVDGLAASAASLIAMAGNKIRMAANSLLMIHNAWTVTSGNKEDLAKTIDVLAKIDQQLRSTYAARSGRTETEIGQMMDAETWLTAEEAVAKGLADEVGQPLQVSASVEPGRFKNTPARMLAGRIEPAKGEEAAPPPVRRAANVEKTLAAVDKLRAETGLAV
jgi:ATP-dependent Clp protease protease subunit